MTKFIKRSLLLALALLMAGAWLLTNRTSAAFNKNLLITDSIFSNSSTMSAARIDAFLNTFPSSCISTNKKFSAVQPTGYNPSQGYLYGNKVSAGQVIYSAAQAYGLNPQVLLATLQKEQSLVSGTAGCSVLRYTGAMGYGCPDGGHTYNYSGASLYAINGKTVTSVSGTCVNTKSKAGFSQQVIHAAWLLKFGQERSRGNVSWAVIKGSWDNSDDPGSCYGGPMTRGTFKRCSDGSATSYDGYTTIDGGSTFMGSGATASLYWYTPHLHGNQTFVSIFEGWFGSTVGLADVAHPDGSLIKLPTSAAVFLIRAGTLWNFPNQQALYSYGYDFGDVKPATDPDSELAYGGLLSYREGSLVRGSGPAIFAIDDQSGTLVKRAFSSWDVFKGLGFNINEVQVVPDASLPASTGAPISSSASAHPEGSLVKPANSGAVYLIQGGNRLVFPSPAVLYSQGFGWSRVKTANAADLSLPESGPVKFREGTLVRGSAPSVFAIDDNGGTLQKRAFANINVFNGLRFSFNEVFNVPDAALPAGNGTTIGP